MLSTALFAATMFAATPAAEPAARRAVVDHDPAIALWTNERDHYRRGDRARVWFRAETDGYVTVFRVDTDGRLRVLYPRSPWDDNFVRGGRNYVVPDPYGRYRQHAFVVDDYPGQGYLFAVLSLEPFDYGAFAGRDRWDYDVVAAGGRITGDPYVELVALIEYLVPVEYAVYGYDIVPYFVAQRYSYPRFMCYECHGYVSYPVWDPYREWCGTFRLVIYERHVYRYPARIGGGTRVVYRPAPIEPRFVFTERKRAEPPVSTVRGRPVNPTERRPIVSRGSGAGVTGDKDVPVRRRPHGLGRDRDHDGRPGDPPGRPERGGGRDGGGGGGGGDDGAARRPEAVPQRRPAPEGRTPAPRVRPDAVDVKPRRAPAEPEAPRARPQLERRDPTAAIKSAPAAQVKPRRAPKTAPAGGEAADKKDAKKPKDAPKRRAS